MGETRSRTMALLKPGPSLVLALLALHQDCPVDAFQQSPVAFITRTRRFRLYSSIGDDRPTPPPDDGDGGDGLDEFLTPKQESENLAKAREYMSDTSLPISFEASETDSETEGVDDHDEAEDTAEDALEETDNINGAEEFDMDPESSALVSSIGQSVSPSFFGPEGQPSAASLAKNPYMQVVSKLSPSELISKFTATANPRVQEAVRSTILGLIGNLPKMAFDTTTITTGQRLASLMFQLQMTGYMFKNAEYRLSLSQSLGMTNGYASNLLLTGTDEEEDDGNEKDPLLSGKVKGKLKISYGDPAKKRNGKDDEDNGEESSSSGMELEVDAAAYMSELRSEVSKLKDELAQTRESKEEALRKDLLLYIRTLPAQELQALTNTMSQDVLVSMKGLVQAVLGGIGDGKIGPETVTEQSGEAMAQLCMWQLAVGYNLRELEVREEMKKSLEGILDEDLDSGFD